MANWDRDADLWTGNNSLLDPPRSNRSICQYLVEVTEQQGMRAYVDYALQKYYSGLIPYQQQAENATISAAAATTAENDEEPNTAERSTSSSKSMFVCYEDWMNASKSDNLYSEALEFLYPGGGSANARVKQLRGKQMLSSSNNTGDNVDANTTVVAAAPEDDDGEGNHGTTTATATTYSYEGGHATDHDPELRARLREIVYRLDAEVFDNTVAKSNAVFGCGKPG